MGSMILCPNCGHQESLNDGEARRKVRCPECGVLCPVSEGAPAKPKPVPVEDDEEVARRLLDEAEEKPAPKPAPRRASALPPAPPRKASSPSAAAVDDDDDGKAYTMEGGEERLCPHCRRAIDEEAVLCVHCGLDLRKGKKVVRTYDPLQRTWDLGMPHDSRRKLFLLLTVLGATLALGATLLSGREWHRAIVPVVVLTVMIAFLLGTFFRVVLERDRKGKVKLTRAWRICFVVLAPAEVDLLQYEGVRTDLVRDAGFFEWLICIDLLLYFIVPGVLWWYHIIHKDRWLVALTRDHGQAIEVLYRGNDGELAKEVAATLRDAARLHEETN